MTIQRGPEPAFEHEDGKITDREIWDEILTPEAESFTDDLLKIFETRRLATRAAKEAKEAKERANDS